ncbi:hypothetical protein BDV33DRAFT_190104 [Aspergillus novoparasiticus]|uniref:Uncharacterized protein n=1 Tax=Aspergillus novoparasiticus TaxID=986946 RepID=A0A5N6EXI3_9EURO|nr:hypothetical protein BDV33DRAFT_190104 [Aspergillus novoparasiticus]
MSWLKLHPLSSLDSSDDKTDESKVCSDTEPTYSNEYASNRGYGTDDTLAVTRVLEQYGISCCLVGIAALVFYGAGRVQLVGQAAELLQSETYAIQYRLVKPRGINYYFFLVPSVDVYIDYDLSNFTRSPRGLLYPKLDEWGENNLDLEGTIDVEWAKEKNKRGEEFGGKRAYSLELWQSLVRTNEDRLDRTKPKDVFITQHRVIGAPDPWTELSDMS